MIDLKFLKKIYQLCLLFELNEKNTKAELMQRIEVSERTLKAYLTLLRESLNLEVNYNRREKVYVCTNVSSRDWLNFINIYIQSH